MLLIKRLQKQIDFFLKWFLGDYDVLLFALLMCTILRILTSILLTAYVPDKQENPVSLQLNIIISILMVCVIGIGNLIDKLFSQKVSLFRNILIIYYFLYNAIHAVLGAYQLGLPIPNNLIEKLYLLLRIFL